MTMLQNELYKIYFKYTRSLAGRFVWQLLRILNVVFQLFSLIAIYNLDEIYLSTVTCQLLNHGKELCIVFSVMAMATLKPTKTRRIMLRCNTSGVLVFANGIISQQRIKTLRDFRFTPVRGQV